MSEENNYIEIKKFFDIIDRLGHNTLKEEWSFHAEGDIYSQPELIDPVSISYKIKTRETADISARKPIHKDNDKDNNQIVKGQMFDSVLEFGIWGKDYTEINNTREWLEKFLLRQMEEFKQKGIIKFLFKEQLEDLTVDINNNTYTEQRLHYLCRNQRLVKVPYQLIESIESDVKSVKGFEDNLRKQNYFNQGGNY